MVPRTTSGAPCLQNYGGVRRLHEKLGISAEVLIRPSREDAA
jgi:hypothetical protein